MMTRLAGPFTAPDNAAEAVAAAFVKEGVRREHVEVGPIDAEAGTWRWRLLPGAPVVVDG